MTSTTPSRPVKSAAPGIDLTGRTLGDFHVLRRLGQGGMGQVYLAEQRSLKRKVALKILRADVACNPTALQRFRQEAESVAKATHANIVQVYASGEADGIFYMALEYVEGRNLKEYLAKKGPPDVLLALSFMRQIAAALQRASELGIIHRDIKPENIMLTRKGEVKVADFGLSRCLAGEQPPNLTQSGVSMGTPLYMSPEQVEGKPVDPRTDIYSFGATCYHMMAGHPPYRGENAFEVALQHVRGTPEPLRTVRPDLPAALCAVIHKMMARDPAERYQSCRDLLKDLGKLRDSLSGSVTAIKPEDFGVELLCGGELAAVTPDGVPTPVTSPARATAPVPAARGGWLMVLAGASVLLTLCGSAFLGWLTFGAANRWRPAAAAAPDRPPDPEAEAVVNAQKREQTLRDAVKQYLSPTGTSKNPAVGFGLCVDLGLFYLETNRLDSAEEFYASLEDIKPPEFSLFSTRARQQFLARLDGLKQNEPYRVLGHVGRAMVLARQSRAKESNRLFKEVFNGKASPEPRTRQQILQHQQMQYWLAEAVHYNLENGIPLESMPPALRRFHTQNLLKQQP